MEDAAGPALDLPSWLVGEPPRRSSFPVAAGCGVAANPPKAQFFRAQRAPYIGAGQRGGRSGTCFVVKLHYVIVLCGAERVRTISHESLQCLCFERRSQSRCSQKLAQKTLLDGQNFWIGARPASGRGGSAHRLRSGLRPRAADRRPVLGIGAVPPPAAPAGCQSPVSGAGLETQRLVREALSLHSRPHAMLLARNKHRTECLAIQR